MREDKSMAQYIIALRPVVGRASGLVRVGPEGARFSLRGVSFGRAHLIMQNGRTLSADIQPTPGGGTAFIRLRGRECVLGAAVTTRGIVVLIGTTGSRASDILEKARLLAADPEQRKAEEAAALANAREPEAEGGAEAAKTPEKAPEQPPAPQSAEPEKPEALAALAAKEEPFLMPQPPMADVERKAEAPKEPEAAQAPWGTVQEPEEEARAPVGAQYNRRTLPEEAAKEPETGIPPKAVEIPSAVQDQAKSPVSAPIREKTGPAKGETECAACSEAERGGMIASFMLENQSKERAAPAESVAPAESAPPPESPAAGPAAGEKAQESASAETDAKTAEAESPEFMEARSPHAFYQPAFDEDPAGEAPWGSGAADAFSEETKERPMVGRRLGVFANAFPGDWPRVNWQVFSHPGGTHLLRARVENKELYAIPARPSATPPAGIPAHARYSVSRTGQGYWVF